MATRPTPAEVTEALLRCPALLYRRLHRQGALLWSRPDRMWMVTGYELARLVLRDPRFRLPGPPDGSAWAEGGSHGGFLQSMLLASEGERHARLRRFFSGLFTPRAVRARTTRIEAATASLFDGIAPRPRIDGVTEITARLPVSVIGDLVGIPESDRDEVSELCRLISKGGGVASGQPGGREVGAALAHVDELTGLVHRWLAVPHRLMPDSVLAAAAAARDTPEALSDVEIVANVFSLYIAGHDTSRNMLSGLLLRLATHPELLGGLAAGAVDVSAEVDRLLLGESPLTFTVRVAQEDCELEGHRIRAGDRIRVMLGAANHELLASSAPADNAGVSFGEGRHVCLGAHLARTEGRVLLRTAGRRWSGLRPAAPPVWAPHFLHRGLDELMLEIEWRR
ncbi:cytochrome P450 [Planomonospora parontospora subsp. parontospora]|uniref:Cytochrome P450 n=2 Tax=Planomonospora parontospora TaxID=58119 RepID=A0AA37BJT5_9ACTN|nr:cytochrome P450 [Planomonospora parontospora]GGK82799.1 cytochrome P450 [Planomonospora parontospora]GII12215.1 cytochrome P450 [Planomonospora parontospora subsp. parontospora]